MCMGIYVQSNDPGVFCFRFHHKACAMLHGSIAEKLRDVTLSSLLNQTL